MKVFKRKKDAPYFNFALTRETARVVRCLAEQAVFLLHVGAYDELRKFEYAEAQRIRKTQPQLRTLEEIDWLDRYDQLPKRFRGWFSDFLCLCQPQQLARFRKRFPFGLQVFATGKKTLIPRSGAAPVKKTRKRGKHAA